MITEVFGTFDLKVFHKYLGALVISGLIGDEHENFILNVSEVHSNKVTDTECLIRNVFLTGNLILITYLHFRRCFMVFVIFYMI